MRVAGQMMLRVFRDSSMSQRMEVTTEKIDWAGQLNWPNFGKKTHDLLSRYPSGTLRSAGKNCSPDFFSKNYPFYFKFGNFLEIEHFAPHQYCFFIVWQMFS